MTEPIVVVGGGGHAKVLVGLLHALGTPVAAVYDDAAEKWGSRLLGVPVRGPIDDLAGKTLPGILAIGDNLARSRLASRLSLDWKTVVHPKAWVDPTVRLGPGTVVFAGAVVQPEARLGAHVIVNTSATVDHDCDIGDFVHLCPGTHLAGGVTIGEGTMLGTGASAIPHVRVGEWTVVGAAAAIVRDLPAHVVAAGVPARPRGQPARTSR